MSNIPAKFMFTLESNTELHEIENLLESGIRLFRIHLAFALKTQIDQLILRLQTAIYNVAHQCGIPFVISLVYDIRGRKLRVGRIRCEKILKLLRDELVVLTSNEEYALCSVREVIYISNFEPYLKHINIGDLIFLGGKKVQLMVVKVIGCNVTCVILKNCEINSYMEVIVPYLFEPGKELTNDEIEDIDYAIKNFGDYISVDARLCTQKYMQSLKSIAKDNLKFIATFDENLNIPNMYSFQKMYSYFEGFNFEKYQQHQNAIVDYVKSQQKFVIVTWSQLHKWVISLKDLSFLDDVDCYNINNRDQIKSNNDSKSMTVTHKSEEGISFTKCVYPIDLTPMKTNVVMTVARSIDTPFKLLLERKNSKIIAIMMHTNHAKVLNFYKNIFPIVSLPDFCINNGVKIATKFGRAKRIINVGDVIEFYEEMCQKCRNLPIDGKIFDVIVAENRLVFCSSVKK